MEQDIEKVYKLKINKLEEENSKLQENNEEIKEKFLRNIEETEKLKKQLQSNIRVFNKTIDEQNKKIKELEEENKELKECLEVTSKALDNVAYDQIPIAIADLMIPKALVEEKIEELEDEICGDDEYLGDRQCIELELLEKVQKKLLEKRK